MICCLGPVSDNKPILRPTALFRLYRGLTRLILPMVARKVTKRLADHGVPESRQRERLGYPTQERPDAEVIWFHGASVGESLSALTLITHLGERLPKAEFLVTSGTATSAELVAKRLPPRARHQFAALDAPGPIRRFLNHWQPKAGIFVESEIWPETLTQARTSGARLALVNARLSEGSVRNWQRFPKTARFLLDQFATFLTQNDQMAKTLEAMGADPKRIHPGTNLKAFAPALPCDATALAGLREDIGTRPVWVASSTHEGEEETVLAAHGQLLQSHPDLLLILVPRHPERAETVRALLQNAEMAHAQRSQNDPLKKSTQVYLADTLGELGLWYALSPLVFLGGSLKPIGGHNPFEPARSSCAVMTGPGTFNFAETFAPLIEAGGATEIADAKGLVATLSTWLTQPDTLELARKASSAFVTRQDNALDNTIDTLCEALDLKP